MKKALNGETVVKLLELAPESVRNEIFPIEDSSFLSTEITALALFYACRSYSSMRRATPLVKNLAIDAQTIHALIQLVATEAFSETATLLGDVAKASASKKGRNAVNARHQKEGSRHNEVKAGQARILAEWKSGKYTTKTKCVDEEYEAAGISRTKAVEALRNK